MYIIEKNLNSDHAVLSSSVKGPLTKSKTNPITSDKDQSNCVSINDMNAYIIKCILSLILPVDNVSPRSQSFGLEFYELQRFLCSNPSVKIIEIYNVMSSATSLSSSSNYGNSSAKSNPLLKKLFSIMPKYKSNTNEQFKSLNSLIISRGSSPESSEYNTKSAISQIWQEIDLIKKNLNPVEWNPFTMDFWSSSKNFIEPNTSGNSNTSSSLKSKTNSLTIATNRNKSVDYLKEIVLKSKQKYSVGAYLHWYEKFNINNDHFQNAFENLNTIIDSYEQMTS
jgi:hypothetical protein